jgi:transposase
VALEACGSAHWWARKITALGHQVVLLHPKFIRPFDQQAMLGLHRMRSLLIKFRTMQVNQLRGLLYEFGASFRVGRAAGLAEIRARMTELEDALPGTVLSSLQDQLRRIDGIEQDIDRLERKHLTQTRSRVPGDRGSARHRQAHRDGAGRHDRGCEDLQIRP